MAMEQVNDLAYPRTGKRGVPQQFPRRLYNMLESEAQLQLERSDAERLIAWSETGKAFRIEDVTLFSTLVLPKYFRTNKFSSFQRNLNLYGFSKLRRGPDADMYAHPSFLRGRPEMLSQLKKCKTAVEKTKYQEGDESRKKRSLPGLISSSKEPIQPVPLVQGLTRAVSPSSGSSDEDTNTSFPRLLTIPRQSHDRNKPKPHHYPLSRDNDVYHSMSRIQQQQQHLTCQKLLMKAVAATNKESRTSALAESNGKLDLLTLAVTCLAESGTAQSL
eukprot:CAMPEP_0176492992 /NCGR_PEP_ID=MMETSP0200_2-20121128/9314_1 /TAXON_ID=947934 /ORGANISM="Chaetoceros sp., Strain GSL56" /LENGTH=273 /DNA_ID=CAMNT_0017890631 /DNA_START=71 /DNA_END=892 /DNA_ORIENTATION=+